MAAKKKELSLEERAKNYGSEIQQISDFVAQVRQTPDVFIGKVKENAAFITMTREIFQNSIDEILKGNAFSPVIKVQYDERNHQVTVSDNGRGIPHGKIGVIFGESHTSSNYVKEPYKYSAGKNGCGGSTTNALSSKFTVDSYVLGKAVHVEFIEGHIWDKGEQKIDCPKDAQGSVISFIPNEQVIGEVTSTWKDIYDLLAMITPSAPIGTVVQYTAIDKRGVKHNETIENKDGIITYLINMTQQPFIAPIIISNDDGTRKMDVAFTYDTSVENGDEAIISLNNTCPTDGGTHVIGCLDGITRYFRDYMNKIYLANNKNNKLVCTVGDIRQGLKLAVSTFHLKALYNGQAKELLDNDDMKPFCSQTIMNGLNVWAQSHSGDLQKLCKYFKEVIEMRLRQDKEKVKLSNKFEASSLTGLPAKYLKPNGTRNLELIIVEGDSAFGSARLSRDPNCQGIFPVRGKVPNAFEKTLIEMLNNPEIAGILHILDSGYGKRFDISKCKFIKVIIMADADPDGAHIRTLLLRFFFMYCRPLVEAGRVFAALPPLYGIPERSGYKFFTDMIDFVKYIQKSFSQSFEVKTAKGKVMTQKEVTRLLYNNTDYVSEMNKVANTYAIDPLLLEDILVNRDLPFSKFSTTLKKKYRFLDCNQNGNIVTIKGVCYEKYHEIFVTDQLFAECRNVIPFLEGSDPSYRLNDSVASLYMVMNQFNKFIPNRLDRFKGLGEMDPDMLGVSTLRPDGNRLLVQYTVDKFEKELEEMRYINSNKDLLLK